MSRQMMPRWLLLSATLRLTLSLRPADYAAAITGWLKLMPDTLSRHYARWLSYGIAIIVSH
jgi:hypothetical protein